MVLSRVKKFIYHQTVANGFLYTDQIPLYINIIQFIHTIKHAASSFAIYKGHRAEPDSSATTYSSRLIYIYLPRYEQGGEISQ